MIHVARPRALSNNFSAAISCLYSASVDMLMPIMLVAAKYTFQPAQPSLTAEIEHTAWVLRLVPMFITPRKPSWACGVVQ
ncbi:hypothetical protein NDU88_002797 [Pleurodeles waltl]|uniref:Uncharacterized protein n=1 Tax=Pleurodeles waltl TaxID=8319 RepID=A0AAV7WPM9_PLEWA|nr:hypothetical protein NDU88_002797 [Pleurodeles waltl]